MTSPWISLCRLGISWANTLSADVSSGQRLTLNICSRRALMSFSIFGPTARASMLIQRKTAGSCDVVEREARLEGEIQHNDNGQWQAMH